MLDEKLLEFGVYTVTVPDGTFYASASERPGPGPPSGWKRNGHSIGCGVPGPSAERGQGRTDFELI